MGLIAAVDANRRWEVNRLRIDAHVEVGMNVSTGRG